MKQNIRVVRKLQFQNNSINLHYNGIKPDGIINFLSNEPPFRDYPTPMIPKSSALRRLIHFCQRKDNLRIRIILAFQEYIKRNIGVDKKLHYKMFPLFSPLPAGSRCFQPLPKSVMGTYFSSLFGNKHPILVNKTRLFLK